MLGAGASAAEDVLCAAAAEPPLTTRGAASGFTSSAGLSAADEVEVECFVELGAADAASSEAASVSSVVPFWVDVGMASGCEIGEMAELVGLGADTAGAAGCAPLGFLIGAGVTGAEVAGAEVTGVGVLGFVGSLVCPLNCDQPKYRPATTIAAAATPNNIFLLAPLDFSGRFDPPKVNVGSAPIWLADCAASAGFSNKALAAAALPPVGFSAT